MVATHVKKYGSTFVQGRKYSSRHIDGSIAQDTWMAEQ
jgi:hypothetical protein